ncbi:MULTISPECIES: DUF885 family protein [Roseateles]|uniref:Uncharacterized protein (DUF885 family) n=1 Tax=Pelomonas aquatica TaxID=431058 RepID=A0ABU1ZA31_9BURK|nr:MULTISPECIES: DUF885 domain-containing protein [Roseateles]KQY81719.1 hypothetical protein ASD35_07960 [Pelomonas sp. Root1444]MDR7297483.1 uncharacterized protein (DUF885 family) [Pelomonas aquatica]
MRRRHAISLLATSLSLSLPAFAAPTESQRFHRWLDAQWELTLQRQPILATSLGDPRYNDRLIDTTTAAYRAQARRELQAQIKALAGFDRRKLDPKDRVSYSILKLDLEQNLAGERFPEWMQPISQIGGLPSFLAQMGTGQSIQPFKTTKDYDDWLKRLALAVPVFDGSIANMRAGLKAGVTQPRAVMDKVLPQLTALAVSEPEKSLFWGPIKDFPEAVPAADRERITARMRQLLSTQVLPAYGRLLAFVRDEYMPRARASTAWSALPDGKAWYAHRVQQSTTVALTPDEIHDIGLKEVARILGEMEGVRKQVGFQGDLKAFFKHLQDDPKYYYTKPEDLLAGYRELQKKINGLTPKLFDIAPKADYEVREVEAFRAESAAGASYQGPSADGSRAGVFYVNTFNLKAQPIFGMETLSLHEASPGHHFQVSIAQEDANLPKFRRFGSFYVAYVEGWALYAESLGKELGLFTDPYQWYGRLSDEQLRAMRLVVDTGLHHKGWTRERAIQYMLDNSSMAESDVVSEVERYIVWPGQALGYKIGQLEISKLRAEAEAALGAKFDVKGFHRVVLTAGQVPLPVLRELVQEWVAASR